MKSAKPGRVRHIYKSDETLKSVPKARLRVFRDVVGALAEPSAPDNGWTRSMCKERKSLLKTPFCGIWKGRMDVGNCRSYAKILRQNLQGCGDRT
jgi:hypothetical protein